MQNKFRSSLIIATFLVQLPYALPSDEPIVTNASGPCDQYAVYAKQTLTDKWSIVSDNNCSYYKMSVTIAALCGHSIILHLSINKIGRHSHILVQEILPLVLNNTKIFRARLRDTDSVEYLSSGRDSAMEILFIKERNDDTMRGAQDSLHGFYTRELTDIVEHEICPPPYRFMQDSFTLTDPNYRGFSYNRICSYMIATEPGYVITGKLLRASKFMTILVVEEACESYDELFEWSHGDALPVASFTSAASSITIVFTVWNENFSIQLEKVPAVCECLPAYVLSTTSSAVFAAPARGCAERNCSSLISIDPNDDNNHVIFRLAHTLQSSFDQITTTVGSITYRFDDLGVHDTESLCLSTANGPIKFTYGTGKETKCTIGEGLKMAMSVTKIAPECTCPAVDVENLNLLLDMPASCPAIDCLWSLSSYSSIIALEIFVHLGEREHLAINFQSFSDPHTYTYHGSNTAVYDSFEFYNHDTTLHVWYHRPSRSNGTTSTQARISLQNPKGCRCHSKHIYLDVDDIVPFQSPNWPDRYCHDMNCRYTFLGAPNTRIQVNISYLNLEQPGDVLTLFDDSRNHTILRATGHMVPHQITTSSNRLTATFTTDKHLSLSGFNATISLVRVVNASIASTTPVTSNGISPWRLSITIVLTCLAIVFVIIAIVFYRRRTGGQPFTRWVMFVNDDSNVIVMQQ